MSNTTTTATEPAANAAKSAVKPSKRVDVRWLVFTALMAALSIVLAEFTSFNVPVMPGFISFDFSDVPALLASLTMGPVSGVAVCLLKNLQGCITTMTGCVGELSNFILSACLVLPAGIVGRMTHKLRYVIIGCIGGAVLMGLVSIASNYFITYPAYSVAFHTDIDTLVSMYKGLIPALDGNINGLIDCLVMFNMPFTIIKGLVAGLVCVPLYRRLRPVFNSIYRTAK